MRRRFSIAPLSNALRRRVNEFPSHRSCARAIGISDATLSGILSRLERGDAEVGVDVACRIATFLGRDPREEFKLAELPEQGHSPSGARKPHRPESRRVRVARNRAAGNDFGEGDPVVDKRNGHRPPAGSPSSEPPDLTRKPRVFLSHQVGGDLTGASVTDAARVIAARLEALGFDVCAGGTIKGHLAKTALSEIASRDFFVALITADPKTSGPLLGSETIVLRASTWVVQEIAAAFALDKKVVLLAENDVDFGEIHNDQKVHRFTTIEILRALDDGLNEMLELASQAGFTMDSRGVAGGR